MGGKRANVGGGATTTPAKKGKSMAASPAVPDTLDKPSSLSWVDAVMERFDREMEIHNDPLTWMAECVPDLKAHAEGLDNQFPPIDEANYIKDFEPGTKQLRLWQMGFAAQYGNKGMVQLDTMRNLVELILVNGFKTNTLQPGVEALVICQPNPLFWNGSLELVSLHDDMLPICSVAFVKGWTRCLAAHIVAHLLIKMELTDTVKTTHPMLFDSLCVIHANIVVFSSEADRIDANRGAGTQTHKHHTSNSSLPHEQCVCGKYWRLSCSCFDVFISLQISRCRRS